MFGLLPGSGVSGVSHLVDWGGFLPSGFGAVVAAVLTPVMMVYMATRPSSRLDLAMTAIIAIAVVVVGVLTTRRSRAAGSGGLAE